MKVIKIRVMKTAVGLFLIICMIVSFMPVSKAYLQSEVQDTQEKETTRNNSISGFLWIDENSDGIYDAEESPLTGYPVCLYMEDDRNNAVQAGTTDAEGKYLFENIESGIYVVGIQSETLEGRKYELPKVGVQDDNKFYVTEDGAKVISYSIDIGGDTLVTDIGCGMCTLKIIQQRALWSVHSSHSIYGKLVNANGDPIAKQAVYLVVKQSSAAAIGSTVTGTLEGNNIMSRTTTDENGNFFLSFTNRLETGAIIGKDSVYDEFGIAFQSGTGITSMDVTIAGKSSSNLLQFSALNTSKKYNASNISVSPSSTNNVYYGSFNYLRLADYYFQCNQSNNGTTFSGQLGTAAKPWIFGIAQDGLSKVNLNITYQDEAENTLKVSESLSKNIMDTASLDEYTNSVPGLVLSKWEYSYYDDTSTATDKNVTYSYTYEEGDHFTIPYSSRDIILKLTYKAVDPYAYPPIYSNISATEADVNGKYNLASETYVDARLEFSTDGTAFTNVGGRSDGAALVALNANGLTPNTKYWYRTILETNTRIYTSEPSWFITKPLVNSLTITPTGSDSVAISGSIVQGSENITDLIITFARDAGFTTDVVVLNGSNSEVAFDNTTYSASLTGLIVGQTYYVKVEAEGPGGISDPVEDNLCAASTEIEVTYSTTMDFYVDQTTYPDVKAGTFGQRNIYYTFENNSDYPVEVTFHSMQVITDEGISFIPGLTGINGKILLNLDAPNSSITGSSVNAFTTGISGLSSSVTDYAVSLGILEGQVISSSVATRGNSGYLTLSGTYDGSLSSTVKEPKLKFSMNLTRVTY